MEQELEAFNKIVKLLSPLDKDTQTRTIAAVRLLLDIPHVKHVVVDENNNS
jgi:hypothetical protein